MGGFPTAPPADLNFTISVAVRIAGVFSSPGVWGLFSGCPRRRFLLRDSGEPLSPAYSPSVLEDGAPPPP